MIHVAKLYTDPPPPVYILMDNNLNNLVKFDQFYFLAKNKSAQNWKFYFCQTFFCRIFWKLMFLSFKQTDKFFKKFIQGNLDNCTINFPDPNLAITCLLIMADRCVIVG